MSVSQESAMPHPVKVSTRRHVRGSSLLLVGRLLALLTGFFAQVLTVRYLSKGDYGAFAYALSVATLGATIGQMGLNKAVARFVPIYQERGDERSMFGAMALAVCTVFVLGSLFALGAILFRGPVSRAWVHDPVAMGLLLLLVGTAPLIALNAVLEDLLAVFAGARAIFFRRHVLGPLLKLLAIVVVMISNSTVRFLAICTLLANAIGVGLYVQMVFTVFKKHDLLRRFSIRNLKINAGEILSFSIPLLVLDFVTILKTTMAVLLLGYFKDSTQVAEFRAVVPVAALNLVVLQSFRFLFVPFASRLFERKDTLGINDLFWQSAIWTCIATFPIFVASSFLAKPVVLLLFESRYEQSAIVLAVLAVGNYFNAALGLNSYTLQVFAKIRLTVIISVVTILFGLGLNLLLIPRYGATGAACATTSALILQNLLNHLALMRTTTIRFFEWRYAKVYFRIAVAIAALIGIRLLVGPSVPVAVGAAVAATMLVLLLNRDALQLAHTFPELARLPLMGFLMGAKERG